MPVINMFSYFCPASQGFFIPMKQPLVRTLPDGKHWLLEENYILPLDDGRTVFVPQGFIFDFASIPRFAWYLVGSPATGKHRVGALVHDWLVATDATTWTDAANIFLKVMQDSGVGYLKRYTIYTFVMMFGPFHKPDIRGERLNTLQRAEVLQAGKYYPKII